MAISKNELKRWLDTLADDVDIYIDEGGLTLVDQNSDAYLEVGGQSSNDDDEDEEDD